MKIDLKFLLDHVPAIVPTDAMIKYMVVVENLLFIWRNWSGNFIIWNYLFCFEAGAVNKILYIGFKCFDKGFLKVLSDQREAEHETF